MGQNIEVTVVTPLYNAARTIAQTIESVLAQSYPHWEMLIVDDCSSDNSKEIVQSYLAQDTRIQLIELSENRGAAYARNRAIEEARGRYIAFLDADDLWKVQKLQKQLSFMQERSLALSYSSYTFTNQEGEELGVFHAQPKVSYTDMLKTSSIGCLSAMYDTNYLGKVYMPEIKRRQDYALWLNILKEIEYAEGIDEPLAVYRIAHNSLSSNKFKAAQYQWRVYREIEGLSVVRSFYYFIHYIYYGLKKYN